MVRDQRQHAILAWISMLLCVVFLLAGTEYLQLT
jgi:hypothetical protein